MGTVPLDEARALLDHADRVRTRVRVSAAAGVAAVTVGVLGDSTGPEAAGPAASCHRTSGVDVRVRDTDPTGPTCGPRAGPVDVALIRRCRT